MDPIAHTLIGATLATTGLRRTTALAPAALLIGANAPDIDTVAMLASDFSDLSFRRGWTHGLLALVLWPVLLTSVLLAWDRLVQRGQPVPSTARGGRLLALSGLAVLTHSILDWVNDYGLRWLMPFDDRWFYGDALFVVDPWIWLILGGALFLTYSRRMLSFMLWSVLWIVTSTVVVTNDPALVPGTAMAIWTVGAVALIALRASGSSPDTEAGRERVARAALIAVSLYIGTTLGFDTVERAQVRRMLSGTFNTLDDVMVASDPANPFSGNVVASTRDAYYIGRWNWLSLPRFVRDETVIARPHGPIFDAAKAAPEARRYLTWARFPYVDVFDRTSGRAVQFRDARYRDTGRIDGPIVLLDDDLRIVTNPD